MVLCSGAFDGLHAGHVRYLTAAARLCPRERLYVAIAPDSYIRSAKHRAPYWSQDDRAEAVLALGVVDRVLLQTDDTPAALIRDYHPTTFAKGMDWTDRLPEEVLAACQAVGCVVRMVQTPGRHVREARG